MNVIGIDIGYSNLKIAYGPGTGTPETQLRPAGAAPIDRFGTRYDGKQHKDFIHVLVDDREYVAGVDSGRAELWSRSLHADYPASDSYMALFKAGLLLAGMRHIDVLVTGLPVTQYFDEARREAVVKRMKGIHRLTRKLDAIVGEVKVIPQPIGGLLDYIEQKGVDLEDARVLVVDPGFFSVDWVVVSQGSLQRQSSGTSLNASSVVLEEAANLIASDFGHAPAADSIETAVRKGKLQIKLAGRDVVLAEYLDAAAQKVGAVIAESIQKSLRTETQIADLVVLVGGGAGFYHDVLKQSFSGLMVDTTTEPVLSNARGFWTMGASQ
ncbi:MAG: hypothetical protein A2286_07825 [Gammaproteobacteria bacterium RIFOXYA12_FULL_61_12]|nr:MAG: hypothetical protein A2514_07915 [Gammaproteobacteria bacterium RIFOXYD12_FULL_61_37]OGT91083.1 MAG: hypothetical protein A2286_07825 [Gammaproteobacteria bacterium RIFOXYA12_FULL_61_12]